MKIVNIKFKETAAQRIYSNYMKRVLQSTKSLSNDNQNDIYMEINSHIFESIQNSTTDNEIELLLDITDRLGAPEDVLKALVADKKLELATRTFNPIHVFKALILNFTNGISFIIFFFLYLFLFAFVFLIFAKILFPSDVGLYCDGSKFIAMGFISFDKYTKSVEVLGNWFIPFTIVCIVFFYFLITLSLKLKRNVSNKINLIPITNK